MYYIYRITNLINGKTYIGQHKYKELNDSYMGSGKILKQAYKKYGIENFKKDILVFNITKKDFIDLLEKEYIKFYRSIGKAEYNIADGGEGGDVLKYASKERKDELKRRCSKAHKGKLNQMYGKHHSEETKKKLSESAKKRTGENNSFYGKHHSEETRKKMSESRKGRKLSDEWKRKIGEASRGRHFGPMPEEQKKRLSEIAKASEAYKGRHWYNNGIKNVLSKTCPDGFVPGRLI